MKFTLNNNRGEIFKLNIAKLLQKYNNQMKTEDSIPWSMTTSKEDDKYVIDSKINPISSQRTVGSEAISPWNPAYPAIAITPA